MATFLYHQCDVCKNAKRSQLNQIPDEWFGFDYEYQKLNQLKIISFLTCSFKCYAILVDRAIDWSQEHTNVRIAGMTVSFAKSLLKGCDFKRYYTEVEFEEAKKITPVYLEEREAGKDQIHYESYKDLKKRMDWSKEHEDFFEAHEGGRKLYNDFREKFPDLKNIKDAKIYSKWYACRNKKIYA